MSAAASLTEVANLVEGDREATAEMASGDEVSIALLGVYGYDEDPGYAEISFSYVSDPATDEVAFREMDQSEAETIVGDGAWVQSQVERIASEYAEKGPVLL